MLVGVGEAIIARTVVLVVSLLSPVLGVALGALAIVGKQTAGAIHILLNPHLAGDVIHTGAQLLCRNLLVELEGSGDGTVGGGLADVSLIALASFRYGVDTSL